MFPEDTGGDLKVEDLIQDQNANEKYPQTFIEAENYQTIKHDINRTR